MKIPFFKFDSSGDEIKNVTDVIKSGWLTTASKTAELESLFSNFCQSDFALAVNSCTAALHLALEAIGVGPGDKVIVPSLTFTASAEVVRYLGADPIFVDINPDTLLIERAQIEEGVEKHKDVKACVVVHFGGQSAEMVGKKGIATFCNDHNIKLVVDAAHAFPAYDNYGPVGSIGDVTCFSFYANKTITTGEGGMLVTNDSGVAKRVKRMRLHGIDRDIWDRFTSNKPAWEYDVVAPGFKYNMPDVNAAIGLAQFERAEYFREGRQRCALRYKHNLKNVNNIKFIESRVKTEDHAWHLFPVVIEEGSKVDRNTLIEKLNIDGIGTSVHYKPLHRMKYYKDTYSLSSTDFQNAEKYWRGCLSLPIYHLLSDNEIDYVCDRLDYHINGI